MKPIRLVLLVPALALVLGACSPSFPTAQPEVQPAGEEAAGPVIVPPSTSPSENEPAGVTEPDSASASAAEPTIPALPTDTQSPPTDTPVAVAEECPFSPDLHATDPSTVSLVSGEVQLVEFFAFW